MDRPAVVFADEPTGQLDPETTDAVIDLLFRVRDVADAALVVISHDTQLVERFPERTSLEGGRIVDASA